MYIQIISMLKELLPNVLNLSVVDLIQSQKIIIQKKLAIGGMLLTVICQCTPLTFLCNKQRN